MLVKDTTNLQSHPRKVPLDHSHVLSRKMPCFSILWPRELDISATTRPGGKQKKLMFVACSLCAEYLICVFFCRRS